jgi:hypothetical protein
MKRILFSLFLLFSLFGVTQVDASGKAYVKVGQKITLSTQSNISNPTIQWTLKKGEEIITQSTGNVFSISFSDVGMYTINIVASGRENIETERTTIEIESSINPPIYSRIGAVISSLPKMSEDGKIHLWGEEATVSFSFIQSSGDIKEYRFDGNIYEDADENGVIDDDIENKNDPSFFSGESFSKTYKNTGSPIQARLTIIDSEGREQVDTIDIVFDTQGPNLKQKSLKAILQTLPESDENGVIHLSGNEAEVTLFGGFSEGDIREYRIDKNLNMDSNDDGDTKNDIDNITNASFQNGQPWVTTFKKEWEPIVVQLTVVQENGQGSLVQRRIVFDDEGGVRENFLPVLIISQGQIFTGDSVSFRVFNAPEGTTYSWDFDGDGVFEKEKSESSEILYRFAEEGDFSVNVRLEKEGVDAINLQKQIVIRNIKPGESNTKNPTANFSFDVDKNTVLFDASESSLDSRLANQELSYSWEFGDGTFGNGKTIEHTYAETGEFVVILRVEDSIEKRSATSQSISITEILPSPTPAPEESLTPSEQPSPSENLPEEKITDSSFPSLPWWIIFLLVIAFIPLGYFAWKKINDPDKSFEEIWKETLESFQKHTKQPIKEQSFSDAEQKEDSSSQEKNISTPPDWIRNHEEISATFKEAGENEESTDKKEEGSEEALFNDKDEEIFPPWLQSSKQEESESFSEETLDQDKSSFEQEEQDTENDFYQEAQRISAEKESSLSEEAIKDLENTTTKLEEASEEKEISMGLAPEKAEQREENNEGVDEFALPKEDSLSETDIQKEFSKNSFPPDEHFSEEKTLLEQEYPIEREEESIQNTDPLDTEKIENFENLEPEMVTEEPSPETVLEDENEGKNEFLPTKEEQKDIPNMPPPEPIAYEEEAIVPNWLSENSPEKSIVENIPLTEEQGSQPSTSETSSNISSIVEEAKKDLPEWLKDGIEEQADGGIKGETITLSPIPPFEEFQEEVLPVSSPSSLQDISFEENENPVEIKTEEEPLSFSDEKESFSNISTIQNIDEEPSTISSPPISPPIQSTTPSPFPDEIPPEEKMSNDQDLPDWLKTGPSPRL